MSAALVVVMLGGAGARAEAQPHLESWARSRQVRLQAPTAAPSADFTKTSARAEALLEQARVALGSMDDAAAERHLQTVERLLRSAPELPHSAWLMAEHHALEVQRLGRAGPTPETAALARARQLLEGRRAAALGETSAQESAPPSDTRVRLEGLRAGDVIYWNGGRAALPLQVPAGEHHVRVLRGPTVALAAWVSLTPTAPVVTLPAQTACSSADLMGVRVAGRNVKVPPSVQCPRFIVARSIPRGVEVAQCSMQQCGQLLPWHKADGAVFTGPPQPQADEPFPVWVAVGTGVGAAILTTIVLLNSGLFDDPEPKKTRFVFTGPNSDSAAQIRF